MSRARLRWVRAALLVFLLLAGNTWLIRLSPAHADEENLSDAVQISGLSPEQYRLGDDLRIEMESTLPRGSKWQVETFLQPTPFDSLWEMESFLEGAGFPGWRLSSAETRIPRNGKWSWVIESDQMPWPDASTTGPRGLVVRLSNEKGKVREARTVLIYEPTEQYPQTRINVVLTEDGTLEPRELNKLAKRSGVTIAASTPAEDPGSEKETRSPLQVALDEKGVEIISLPLGGSDASSLAGSDLPDLLDLSLGSRASGKAAGYREATVLPNVILASAEGFTQESLSNLAGNIIISPRGWGDNARWEEPVTPTSLVRPDVRGIPMTVLDNWAPAADLLNTESGTAAEELTLRQRIRALTMMVGLQDPGDQRTLIVRRTGALDLSQAELDSRLDALLNPDWVQPVSFSEVATSPTSEIERPEIPDNSKGIAGYRKRLVPLAEEYLQAQAVAAATEAGPALLDPFEETVLEATGSKWSSKRQNRLVTKAINELKTITEAIHVLPLGAVNMVHQDANFPLSIANQGESDTNVNVAIESSDLRLQTVEEVNVRVAAGGQVEVQVPVKAVGAGDIEVRIVIRTPSGQIVDDSQTVVVRVRPNWEDIGTIAVTAAALTLFGFGLIRSFRSAKRRNRKQSARQAAAD